MGFTAQLISWGHGFTDALVASGVGLLTGASCKKDEGPVADPGAVLAAADSANQPAKVVDRTPVPGIDVTRLPAERQDLFFKMIADLPSPCGKAHSLRTSVSQDQTCKRAPFATKLVAELVVDEAPADDIRDFYEARYIKAGEVQTFDLAKAPIDGNPAATVTLVEFFDYGCAACVQLGVAFFGFGLDNRRGHDVGHAEFAGQCSYPHGHRPGLVQQPGSSSLICSVVLVFDGWVGDGLAVQGLTLLVNFKQRGGFKCWEVGWRLVYFRVEASEQGIGQQCWK